MFRRLLVIATLASTMVLPSVSQATPESCINGGDPTFAKFIRPSGGMVQAQTGPTGALTVQTGGVTPSIFLSTTGTIEVEIEQSCLLSLSLVVTKQGNPTPIHTNSWNLECTHSNVIDNVTIGLDGGEYTFQLSGTSCNGKGIRGDGHGGFVGDPPIL